LDETPAIPMFFMQPRLIWSKTQTAVPTQIILSLTGDCEAIPSLPHRRPSVQLATMGAS
jgi:hypothetical protein